MGPIRGMEERATYRGAWDLGCGLLTSIDKGEARFFRAKTGAGKAAGCGRAVTRQTREQSQRRF